MSVEDKKKVLIISFWIIVVTIIAFVGYGVYELKTSYSESKYIIKNGHNPVWGTSQYEREGNCVSYVDDETNKQVEMCSESLGIYEN